MFKRSVLILPIIALISLSCFALPAPKTINYQGKLLNGSGTPITGPTDIHFYLCPTESSVGSIWDDTISVSPDANGIFNVTLGRFNPLDGVNFNQALWLELQISGSQLVPRQQLAATPYSMRAITAETVQGPTIYEKGGKVGIGTVNPFASLEVSGNISVDSGTSYFGGNVGIGTATPPHKLTLSDGSGVAIGLYNTSGVNSAIRNYAILTDKVAYGDLHIMQSNALGGNPVTAGTSRLIIGNDGKVSVGSATTLVPLDLFGTCAEWRFESGSSSGYLTQFLMNDSGTYIRSMSTSRPEVIQTGGTNGVLLANGATAWSAASDVRLKTNIKTEPVLGRLENYRAVSFNWKETGKHDIGVIAQELYPIFPEVVIKGSDGALDLGNKDRDAWTVQYAKLGLLALQGVKELDSKFTPALERTNSLAKKIQEQQAQIEKQKKDIEELRAEIKKLKK